MYIYWPLHTFRYITVMDTLKDLPREGGKKSSETIDWDKVAILHAAPALQPPTQQ